jgi:hypothetical protein
MNSKPKKLRKIFIGSISVLAVVVLVDITILNRFVDPLLVRIKSKRLLLSAKAPADFEKAVGPLGIFLQMTNGDWVAIHYEDSHAGLGWSQAISFDSSGAWFESQRHFCGQFAIFRNIQARNRESLAEMKKIGASQSEIEATVLKLPETFNLCPKLHISIHFIFGSKPSVLLGASDD